MVKKFFQFLFGFVFISSGFAGPCDKYKIAPDINLKKAEYNVNVKSSEGDLWPEAGYTSIGAFNRIEPNVMYVFNGKYYCVFIKSVDAVVGFKDFDIVIDKKYEKGSCEYNAVLEHEKHHIRDSEKVFEEVFPEIGVALYDIVDSVRPIYTENPYEIPYAIEKLQEQIVRNEKLKELVEKFKKQQESDANELDSVPDPNLHKCFENTMKDAFEKYNKEKEQSNN